MTDTAHVTPLERSALLAAYQSPGHTLRRMGNGFIAAPARRATSGPLAAHNVTKRMALRLERDQLVRLDDPHCPSAMTLTESGRALAQQLLVAANES